MIQNHTTNKQTNIQVKVMTPEELALQKEYRQLLSIHDNANRTAKHAKQRMAQIRRRIDIKELIVDERADEIILKDGK